MIRPVLLGGRTGVHSRSAYVRLLVWVPVLIALLVVCRESTDAFSSEHTEGWIRRLSEWIFGPVAQTDWDRLNFRVRKTGHFIGYGLLALTWLRAWLLTWLSPLRLRTIWRWRGHALLMALCCTMVVASLDELHQSFIPSRTGMVRDVWLDTAGAATMMLLLVSFWVRRPWQAGTDPTGQE